MADASFGPHWPTRNPNIITLVRSDGLRIPLHKEVVEMASILMDLTEMMGYDILPGQTWGYANRNISGTNSPSNHSTGTAIDINAPSNPQSRVLHTNIPAKVHDMWVAHGWRSGADYKPPTKYDPMHYEYMGTVTEARAETKKLKAYLASMGSPAPAAPAPLPNQEDDMIEDVLLAHEVYLGVKRTTTAVSERQSINYWIKMRAGGTSLLTMVQKFEEIAKSKKTL